MNQINSWTFAGPVTLILFACAALAGFQFVGEAAQGYD
jgi:hypothetical protein